MKSTDQKKKARAVVSDRFRVFFGRLKEQLTTSADDLWKREQDKSNNKKQQ
jgi:hypothetical protein